MKISKVQKEQNRRKLIDTAVALMSKEGIRNTTMKSIASAAGVSDAGIYKYFPAKEDIIFAFFSESLVDTIENVTNIPGYEKFTLREQIQAFVLDQLDQFENKKEFLKEAFKHVFVNNFSGSVEEVFQQKKIYFEFMEALFEAAIESEEIQEPPFKNLIFELLWDFQVGLVNYWLNDESENYVKTRELLDLSLDLFMEVLKINLIGRAQALVQFFLKNHLLDHLSKVSELTSQQKEKKAHYFSKKKKIKKETSKKI